MKINLVAVGTKMPTWVEQGYQEYAKRFPPHLRLNLIEVPSLFRGKNLDVPRLLKQEGQKMLQAVPKNTHLVALDPKGKSHSTENLATCLERWMNLGRDLSLLVGGPEGLAQSCLSSCQEKWSLSALTFPHPLVRVVVAESLYRAWTVLNDHPYHRA